VSPARVDRTDRTRCIDARRDAVARLAEAPKWLAFERATDGG